MGIAHDNRMIGGVAEKQIRGELDRVAHRAADQLAEPATGGAAAGVEASQLDARIAGHAQRLQLAGELAVGEGVLADHDLLRPFERRRDILAAVGFADADDSTIGPQFDDVTQEVRPVAAADVEQGRVGKCDGGYFQPSDGQCGLRRSDRECPIARIDSTSQNATGHQPQRVATMWLRDPGFPK